MYVGASAGISLQPVVCIQQRRLSGGTMSSPVTGDATSFFAHKHSSITAYHATRAEVGVVRNGNLPQAIIVQSSPLNSMCACSVYLPAVGVGASCGPSTGARVHVGTSCTLPLLFFSLTRGVWRMKVCSCCRTISIYFLVASSAAPLVAKLINQPTSQANTVVLLFVLLTMCFYPQLCVGCVQNNMLAHQSITSCVQMCRLIDDDACCPTDTLKRVSTCACWYMYLTKSLLLLSQHL